MTKFGQLSSSVDRVASPCVFSTGSSSNEYGSPRFSTVIGSAMAVFESRDATSPHLVIYGVVWKKRGVGQVQPENYNRNSLSASSSSGGGTIMKKGRITKKVSPVPHMLAATFNSW